MRRSMLVATVALLMLLVSAVSASAGEWNKGNFNTPGGDVPAKYNANSECMFSGLDEPDATEGTIPFGDDALWNQKPGQAVQTPGHAMRLGIADPGTPGVACNGRLSGLK